MSRRPPSAPRRARAAGLTRKGRMNGLEAAFERRLSIQKSAGIVSWYRYEGMRLQVTDLGVTAKGGSRRAVYYTPDFVVVTADGEVEIYEVKGGHWEPASQVRFKAAATEWPFTFFVATERNGKWNIEAALDYESEDQ